MERGGVGELRREDAREGVVVEVESPEEPQRAELRGEVARERFSGEGNSDNSRLPLAGDIGAGDPRPGTRRGVAVVPVGESCGGGLVHGGL